MRDSAKKKKTTLDSLITIYNGLPLLAEKNPAIKDEFDMNRYGVYSFCGKTEIKNNYCKTYGCGLGNSARLFKIENSDFNSHYHDVFSYTKFARRILPYCYISNEKYNLWEFLFSSNWAWYQPSFNQFIERVKYAIDKDLELGEWVYQDESFIS